MLDLTFGEQVKIILSRKGMTIKELAEIIEATTGNKMSRQNLTQRLNRDNFQEQDMRMIADILGCSFQLSILANAEAAQRASVLEEDLPTEKELRKIEAKKERKKASAIAIEVTEKEDHDITVGELVEMIEHPVTGEEPSQEKDNPKEEVQEEILEEIVQEAAAQDDNAQDVISQEPVQAAIEDDTQEQEEIPEMIVEETIIIEEVEVEPKAEERRTNIVSMPKRSEAPKTESVKKFEPIKKPADDEDTEIGEINPYTGHEYKTNSVRVHPRRIGYVQVYDRKEHKWTDMTEWAFLGVEEQKKVKLGKDYEPPIYLD